MLEDRTHLLKTYVLRYIIDEPVDSDIEYEEQEFWWRCEAEDYDHAVEQLMNYYEGDDHAEVVYCELYKIC